MGELLDHPEIQPPDGVAAEEAGGRVELFEDDRAADETGLDDAGVGDELVVGVLLSSLPPPHATRLKAVTTRTDRMS